MIQVIIMRLVQMKPVCGLFWTEEYRPLKIFPMGAEAAIPFTHTLASVFPQQRTPCAAAGTIAPF
jgi:hypothetical protein